MGEKVEEERGRGENESFVCGFDVSSLPASLPSVDGG